MPIADTVLILDNSSIEAGSKRIIAIKNLDTQLCIEDDELWKKIVESGEMANV